MGIYAIRNLVNQRVYVAGSTNLPSAMFRDRRALNVNGHRSRRLQDDWLAHGEANFRFEVLDTVGAPEPDPDFTMELDSLLELWRAELKCYGENGYNTRVPSPWLARPN
jgi:hypothetical protein